MTRTAAVRAFADEDWQTTRGRGDLQAPSEPSSGLIAERVVTDRYDGLENVVLRARVAHDEPFFAVPELREVAPGKRSSFSVEKEWEGSVDDIGVSHFTARLSETRHQDSDIELAEIPIGDIPCEHRDDLREGAVFRYLLSYARDDRGTVTKKRLVYFRKGRIRADHQTEQEWLKMASLFTHDSFTE